jgi:hypothetical protein
MATEKNKGTLNHWNRYLAERKENWFDWTNSRFQSWLCSVFMRLGQGYGSKKGEAFVSLCSWESFYVNRCSNLLNITCTNEKWLNSATLPAKKLQMGCSKEASFLCIWIIKIFSIKWAKLGRKTGNLKSNSSLFFISFCI